MVTTDEVVSKSGTAVAISYTPGQWLAPVRCCDDSLLAFLRLTITLPNRASRTVALGRKNYLFAGSDSGGERAAAFYSLVGSAKLNGVDPEGYLISVLAMVVDYPIKRISELLAWNMDSFSAFQQNRRLW